MSYEQQPSNAEFLAMIQRLRQAGINFLAVDFDVSSNARVSLV